MTPDIRRIADGLSEAQRDALSRNPRWSMIDQYNAGILEPLRFGLLSFDGHGHGLTPLGLKVRQHLMENTDD